MGNDYVNGNPNVYFKARKEAAKYNERLSSREGAAEALGVSTSTLTDYELGITKVVPVDKVVLMADLYNAPELKNIYCKTECPIGKYRPIACETSSLEGAALRMINVLDEDEIRKITKEFARIASNGVVTEEETERIRQVIEKLDEISEVISEVKLIGEKISSRSCR